MQFFGSMSGTIYRNLDLIWSGSQSEISEITRSIWSLGMFLSTKIIWLALTLHVSHILRSLLLNSYGPVFWVIWNARSRSQFVFWIASRISSALTSSLLTDWHVQPSLPLRCYLISSQQKDLPEPGVAKGKIKVTVRLEAFFYVLVSSGSSIGYSLTKTRLVLVSSTAADLFTSFTVYYCSIYLGSLSCCLGSFFLCSDFWTYYWLGLVKCI